MYYIIKISLLLFLFSILGCSSTTNDNGHIPPPDASFRFLYTDQNGEDLLNPEHPDSWDEENLGLYYLRNGSKVQMYEANLDNPKGLNIYHSEDRQRYILRLWVSPYLEENTSITFLEFPDGSFDTLEVQGQINEYDEIDPQKLWYNSNFKWEKGSETSRYFEIDKSVVN